MLVSQSSSKRFWSCEGKTRPNEFGSMTARKTIKIHPNRHFAIKHHTTTNKGHAKSQKAIKDFEKAIKDYAKSQKGLIWTLNATRNSSSNDDVPLNTSFTSKQLLFLLKNFCSF